MKKEKTRNRRCKHCGKIIEGDSYARHVAIHLFERHLRVCTFCYKEIDHSEYENHLKECKKNPNYGKAGCEYCKRMFPKLAYDSHRIECKKNPDNGKVGCEYCKRVFPKSAYDRHRVECKKNPNSVRVGCVYCKQMMEKSAHDHHFTECVKHYTKIYCEFCKQEVWEKIGKPHIEECEKNPDHSKVKCEYCKKMKESRWYDLHLVQCAKRYTKIYCEFCKQEVWEKFGKPHIGECREAPNIIGCSRCGLDIRRRFYVKHCQNNCRIRCHCGAELPGYDIKKHLKKCDAYWRYLSPKWRGTLEYYTKHLIADYEQEVVAKRVSWQLLPPGDHPFEKILSHYESSNRKYSKDLQIDVERLKNVHSLCPDAIYVGLDEFERYIVFYFQEARTAVLECPVVGNATYIIRGDWERLSRLSKKELLESYSDKVTRLVHVGDWLYKLKRKVNAMKKM